MASSTATASVSRAQLRRVHDRNLLAHSTCSGEHRQSGAYNRTLTPFGSIGASYFLGTTDVHKVSPSFRE